MATMEKEEREKLRQEAGTILYSVWRDIPWDKIPPSRRLKIYDEFHSKMLASANTQRISGFIENLCSKWGIRCLTRTDILDVEQFNDDDALLDVIRRDSRLLLLRLRERIEEGKERFAEAQKDKDAKHKEDDQLNLIDIGGF